MDLAARNERILQLYRSGMLLKEIASEVDLKPHTVGGILKKLGVERPSKPQKRWNGRPDTSEKIADLWEHGLCASQIAERIGMSQCSVSQELTRMGLTSAKTPRHRYDGIGGIGGRGRADKGAFARMARRT